MTLFGQPVQQQQQARPLTIFDTLVDRNPAGVRSFLAARGMPPSNTNEEMKARLYSLFSTDKQGTFRDMLNLHPDKEMILDELAVAPEPVKSGKSACGCKKGHQAPAPELSLEKLGINGSLLNGVLMLFGIFLLIKIIKGT